MSKEKSDSVPGLGFKDNEVALQTIKNLDGRDPDYQKLAVKGLIGRANRVLTLTKDKEKLQNIKDAMSTFEKFLKDFEKNGLSKDNRAYIPFDTIKILEPLFTKYNVSTKKSKAFMKAYESAKEYKSLRTVESDEKGVTWDIIRNKELKEIWKANIDADMWTDDDIPTKDHMEMIMWGFSPEASKIKKNLDTLKEKLGGGDKKSVSKRKPESSDSSSDESPSKKKK